MCKAGSVIDPYLPLLPHVSTGINSQTCSNPDVFNYVIETPSLYTHQQLKAYKSLEAYKHFVNGWVSNVTVCRVMSHQETFIVTARVTHSQRISETLVQAWLAVEQVRVVFCAHCTCMAGLGEVCSHIVSIFFTVDANTRLKQSTSCTSLPCSWLPPPFSSVPYAKIADIDFSAPTQKRRKTLEPSSAVPQSSTDSSSEAIPFYI